MYFLLGKIIIFPCAKKAIVRNGRWPGGRGGGGPGGAAANVQGELMYTWERGVCVCVLSVKFRFCCSSPPTLLRRPGAVAAGGRWSTRGAGAMPRNSASSHRAKKIHQHASLNHNCVLYFCTRGRQVQDWRAGRGVRLTGWYLTKVSFIFFVENRVQSVRGGPRRGLEAGRLPGGARRGRWPPLPLPGQGAVGQPLGPKQPGTWQEKQ